MSGADRDGAGPDLGGAAEQRALAALAEAAEQLRERTAPDPEFARGLRGRLVGTGTAPVPLRGRRARRDPAAPRRLRHRATVVLAAAAALVLVAVVVTIGTSRALPGSPLYGAKRAVEAFQLSREDGPLDEGIARLHLAEKRLREVRALADGRTLLSAGPGTTVVAGGLAAPDADRLRSTLAAMDEQTRRGSRLVEQVARDSGDSTPLSVLQAWAGMQTGNLEQVTATLPSAARPRAAASLQVLEDLRSTATALQAPGCLAPGATCPGTGPR